MLLFWIILFSMLGSAGAIGGAALLLAFPGTRKMLLTSLLSYATGTLLGAAFLGMIPAGLRYVPAFVFSSTILCGIVLFFLLEKLVLWRHYHGEYCEVHGAAGILILIGDSFHNFIDGLAIASAFIASFELGTATALAVIAHEIPQEVGDFAILLDSGYSRARAFVYNLLSSAVTIPGSVIGYFFLGEVKRLIPYVLALSAASFIYIATADLVPALHRKLGIRETILQSAIMLAGIGTIAIFHI